MIIDLHTHSRFSDGTQTPAELVDEAAMRGIDVLGLTDHDTISGWDEAAEAARAAGIGLVRGMEISCRLDGIGVHLLGYLFDSAADSALMEVVRTTRQVRTTRMRTMVERLAEDFAITLDDVLAQAGEHTTIGRPHIADALVHAGIVPSRDVAFAGILSSRERYYVPVQVLSPLEAIHLVHEAGGVTVFAHPAASARGRVLPAAGMREMIDAGLDGIEVDHRDNPPEARERLRALAASHGLIVTGSSDYHGAGKVNRLGEHTTASDMFWSLVERATGSPYLPG